MIYFCADDYGLCESVSEHIDQCINSGVLNKVSIFPNFDDVDLCKIVRNKNIRLSLHINLVEGKSMADLGTTDLIADPDGNFIHRFGGLFKLSVFCGKKLEVQVYNEIKAQVKYWKSILPDGVPFCIDSHQHTHMIPAVFRAMLRVLEDEGITPEYIRIPAEPLSPFLTTPSLYFTYNAVNIVKQWLLKALWLINKKRAKKHKIQTSLFFGILFSGKMDAERVGKILPKYIEKAEKSGMDTEVLFHPGYIEKNGAVPVGKNIVFKDFYLSRNRKTEFESVSKISEGSVR